MILESPMPLTTGEPPIGPAIPLTTNQLLVIVSVSLLVLWTVFVIFRSLVLEQKVQGRWGTNKVRECARKKEAAWNENLGAAQSRVAGDSPMNQVEFQIHPCGTTTEFRQCGEIQQKVWRCAERDVAPVYVFVNCVLAGGHVFAAFIGERMVGFSLCWPGLRDEVYMHSYLAFVLPEFQGRGIGRCLKLAQREACLRRGIKRIEWVFDPMRVENARFNFRFGVIACVYLPDFLGETTSPLHFGLPTDRIRVEWHITSAHVAAALDNETRVLSKTAIRVEIPQRDEKDAREQQLRLRERLEGHFHRGSVITGIEGEGKTYHYILERRASLRLSENVSEQAASSDAAKADAQNVYRPEQPKPSQPRRAEDR
jgi:predicted GNAT superfamily acetyltransferase